MIPSRTDVTTDGPRVSADDAEQVPFYWMNIFWKFRLVVDKKI